MCALAKLAKLAGHQVSGSDKAFYPPGGDMARQLGITLYESYEDAADNCKADVYVIGNAISRDNPLAERILNNGGDYISAPQWLYENVLCKRKVLAVAGTHGKTTTASLLIKLLTAAKMSPGFVIGGASSGGDILAQPGEGEWFVVEADEYDSAFFDKRPKFLHYRPRVAIINNMEFDHADIYDNIGDIIRQFHYLLRSVPANGAVVVNADSDAACKAMQMGIYSPPVWFNAGGKKNNHNWHWHFDGKQMTVFDGGRLRCSLQPPLAGSANRDNITAALAAASFAGVDISCASELLKDYRRRMRRLTLIQYNRRAVQHLQLVCIMHRYYRKLSPMIILCANPKLVFHHLQKPHPPPPKNRQAYRQKRPLSYYWMPLPQLQEFACADIARAMPR